jgi:uncharacterized protein (UPF0147 family)
MDGLKEAAQQHIEQLIQEQLDQALSQYDFASTIASMVEERMSDPKLNQYINAQIKQAVDNIQINDVAVKRLDQRSLEAVNTFTPKMQQYVRDRTDRILADTVDTYIKDFNFPQASISHHSIDFVGFSIKQIEDHDSVKIKGIESFSNGVELTVLDGTVVVENNLVTKNIRATSIETDDLILNENSYNQLRDRIANSISIPQPIDFTQDIHRLQQQIDTSKKREGNFREIEVSGEALLSDVLYTTPGNRRVGINTMDPSDALTVWDNETEVVIGKHKAQEGYIGTRRRQDVNIGANNKVGLTVRSDGSVAIGKLELFGRTISESASVPGHAAKKGDIVLNSKPQVGNPVGWVCLDGIRWSGFGLIQ